MSGLVDLASSKILVTGASGIIGSNLLKALLSLRRKGAEEISVVTKSGVFPNLGIDYEKVKTLNGDLLDSSFVDNISNFDLIFHAAGYGQPAKFMADGISTMLLNSEITRKLLARVNPGGRFIFFSSSEIYSGSLSIPYNEEHIGTTNPLHERASYIEGKRFGEALTNIMGKELGISTCSIRIALVYGPGTKRNDARVLYSFIDRALNDRKLVMMDLGKAMRAYCFIEDAIKLIIKITTDGTKPIYNLGGRELISIRSLAEEICFLTGAKFELPTMIIDMGSAPSTVLLDMTRTLDLFDQEFEFTQMRAGLRKTIDWQKMCLD